MSSPKPVDELSVKQLKQELADYDVDFKAAGCVEKKDMKALLKKTRKERGWPPKKSSNADDKSASNTSKAKSSSSSSTSNSRNSSGAGITLSSDLRVAIVFDPDNTEIRDCAQFIQPFFMHTPECSDSRKPASQTPKISWFMPASLREDLLKFNLPEQLAAFDWFTAVFVEDDGSTTDFDEKPVKIQSAVDTKGMQSINQYVALAQGWGAAWIMVRRPGGVLPARWLTRSNIALNSGKAAVRTPGCFTINVDYHSKQVIKDNKGVLVPESLTPKDAWYYWLMEVYPESLLYQLDPPEEADTDADKVMVACEDSEFVTIRDSLSAPKV
eukprot:CAMPEP_0168601180 /NCGR_PEP_ID=MMETSP0420-20121227/13276_1 /TAXON_ID=498008 /ORGANISM="Pessonella sp." /LENGTH=326 /DNA_ID=CAMNT_0008639513 /DNA_START=10 /DNA_END=990 /DNA_ORIENTATION=-